MSGLGRVVRAGVARRRAAAIVTGLSTLAATAAAVAAAAMMIASAQPFEHAFVTQHGAHLTATFDGTKAGAARLAATAHANGVTASAGPFPEATTTMQVQTPDGLDPNLPDLSLVGRAQAGGPVDDVTLISGHWVSGPGQIVLSTDLLSVPLGTTVQFLDASGQPKLTVVGYAQSVTKTADAWVEPSQAFALADKGAPPTYQMLYRFAQSGTDAQILADRAAVTGMLPKDALIGSSSYLATQIQAQRDLGPFVPFIVAFGVLALATAVLIITNVVGGAVGAALFKIGVLKALGATPGQVVRSYALIALMPAAVGVVAGAVLGNVIADPLLRNAEVAYGTGALSVPLWVDLVVPLAALALVGLCALVPALRAGRMSATAALAVGRAPRSGRGRFARRFLAGLPIPQPVGLGLGAPPTRPARYLSITAALVFGTMALTFAVGLRASLSGVDAGLHQWRKTDVSVMLQGSGQSVGPGGSGQPGAVKGAGGEGAASAADITAIEAAMANSSGTAGYYGMTEEEVTVVGSSTSVNAKLYDRGVDGLYQMIAGTWYTGPDQAVVPTSFLSSTGTHIGDEITLVYQAQRVRVRIVGEALDSLDGNGLELIADASTFSGIEPSRFGVTLKPGTNANAYIGALNNAISGHNAFAAGNAQHEDDQTIIAMDALAAALTLLVVATAGLGVFNTVMLELRDRVREIGVYKAIGMTPKQTTAMVLSSTVSVGVVAGILGVPAGIALHHYVIPVMGHAAGTDLPPVDINVFGGVEDVLLALGGAAIAVLAAMIPAGWAARLRTATALRTE